MSLDVHLTAVRPTEVYWANITHNITGMAEQAGIYKHLWCPEEINITLAGQLIKPLRDALTLMESDPPRFAKHNAVNGWGNSQDFIRFVREYLQACEANPNATIEVSR